MPEYVASIGNQFKVNVTTIFLVKTDENKIFEGFGRVRVRKNDWLLNRHSGDSHYLKSVASVIAERGRYFEDEAKKYGFRVINTQDNFDDQLNMLTEEFFQARKALRVKERRQKSE